MADLIPYTHLRQNIFRNYLALSLCLMCILLFCFVCLAPLNLFCTLSDKNLCYMLQGKLDAAFE